MLRRGLQATVTGDRIAVRIQRELKSPNLSLGAHWRLKTREKKQWTSDIVTAIVVAVGVTRAQALLGPASGLFGANGGPCSCRCETKRCCCPVTFRRRIRFTRFVPSTRNFIRDEDNLAFSTKHVVDCLTELGLIRDDNQKWADRPLPTQAVSGDGTWWTEIVIDEGPPQSEEPR